MGSNLPPGVTASDIDDNFGEPEMKDVYATVEVDVMIRTQHWDEDSELRSELRRAVENGSGQAVEVHIVDID